MAAEPLTPNRRRELTRSALLDAAETVFAERGYEAAALDDIAATAGFTKGAIYSNFGNRQDLFLAVMGRHNQRLLDAYAGLLEKSTTPPDATAIARVWTEHELANRTMLALALEFRLRALRDEETGRLLAEFERQTEQLIARFVAKRLSDVSAAIDVPIEEFAAIVYAANQGLWQHVATCATKHPQLFETFLEVLMRGASADPAPARTSRRKASSRK